MYNLVIRLVDKASLDDDKKEKNQVFTPTKYINKLLDVLPTDIESAFDPCAGIGNFGMELLAKNSIKLDNLYMSEINEDSAKLIKLFLPEFKNLHVGNTLEYEIDKKFDLVMCNPPFTIGTVRPGKNTAGCKVIWPAFLEYCLKHLKKNGHLIFICPVGWFRVNSKAHKILKYNIKKLIILPPKESEIIFGVGCSISMFVLQKTREKTETDLEIKGKTTKIFLSRDQSIPNFSNIDDVEFWKKHYLSVRMSKPKIEIKKIKTRTIGEFKQIDRYTKKDGYKYIKTAEHPDQNKLKLIIPSRSGFDGLKITDKYGICGDIRYILGTREELELYKSKLESEFAKRALNMFKYRMGFIEDDIFDFII